MTKSIKPREIGNRYVETIIDREGNAKVEAHGFTGRTCVGATKSLEVSLGTVSDRTEKKDDRGPRQLVGKN